VKFILVSKFSKAGKWVPLYCSIVGVGKDFVKFELNDISLYTKNESEQRRSVRLGYFIIDRTVSYTT